MTGRDRALHDLEITEAAALLDSGSVSAVELAEACLDRTDVVEPVIRAVVEQDPDRIRARACECLAMVGLEGAEEKLPSELSGGMKKRAGLARAIVMEPEYILYDEPTTGLDPITSDAINDLIIKLQEQLGVTSIVVTHDMPSAFKVGDRVAMLSRGKIVYTGAMSAVRESDHPMVRQFIEGSSQGPLGAF